MHWLLKRSFATIRCIPEWRTSSRLRLLKRAKQILRTIFDIAYARSGSNRDLDLRENDASRASITPMINYTRDQRRLNRRTRGGMEYGGARVERTGGWLRSVEAARKFDSWRASGFSFSPRCQPWLPTYTGCRVGVRRSCCTRARSGDPSVVLHWLVRKGKEKSGVPTAVPVNAIMFRRWQTHSVLLTARRNLVLSLQAFRRGNTRPRSLFESRIPFELQRGGSRA